MQSLASSERDMHAQAETARRMQVEYETKVAAIKAEGERRREAEVRRRQQRYAALDRLQAAAATEVGNSSSHSGRLIVGVAKAALLPCRECFFLSVHL